MVSARGEKERERRRQRETEPRTPSSFEPNPGSFNSELRRQPRRKGAQLLIDSLNIRRKKPDQSRQVHLAQCPNERVDAANQTGREL